MSKASYQHLRDRTFLGLYLTDLPPKNLMRNNINRSRMFHLRLKKMITQVLYSKINQDYKVLLKKDSKLLFITIKGHLGSISSCHKIIKRHQTHIIRHRSDIRTIFRTSMLREVHQTEMYKQHHKEDFIIEVQCLPK
jgi:hypothetical protein